MAAEDLVFVILAVIAGATAFYSVVTRYLLRSIISLGAFLTVVAGLFFLLAADFVAVIQIFVYVGGVVVLILFALMLSATGERHPAAPSAHSPGAALVAYALGAWLIWAALVAELPPVPPVPDVSVEFLGRAFLGPHVYPFELMGVILLAALAAALTIIRGERQ